MSLLAKILTLRGPDQPIVVDEAGVILKGHGRRLAAIEAGMTEFPVVVRSGMSEAAKRAMRVEDNQLALLSGWDRGLLRAELSELKLEGYDLPLLGFDAATLSWMTDGVVVVDPAGEWGGMPAFDHEDKTAFRSIVVHFKDQAAVDAFAHAIGQKVGKLRSIWYPEAEVETYADKRYAAE